MITYNFKKLRYPELDSNITYEYGNLIVYEHEPESLKMAYPILYPTMNAMSTENAKFVDLQIIRSVFSFQY